ALPDDCPIPDPLDLLTFLAARTTTLGLATGVLVLPNHHPVVLAKRAATLDVLSGGRLRLCVGAGWMREEVEACGVDFGTRGRRADEQIQVLRALWAGNGEKGVDHHGEFFDLDGAMTYPRPTRGDVPVHVGGHSRAAARRAGRYGDGLQPLGVAGEALAALVAEMRSSAVAAGRDPDALELSLGHLVPRVDAARAERLAELGASRIVLAASDSPDLAQQLVELLRVPAGADGMRDELSDLVHRYALLVDDRDWDGVAALFTEDGLLVSPEPPRTLAPDVERRGRDDIRAAMSGLDRALRTVHEVFGEVYDETPDGARGVVRGAAHHLMERDGDTVDLTWRLRYDDAYRRTPAGWLFARRALTIDVVEVGPVQKVRR
ncbi:MAG: TIGR03619 family F420-dependent LLM class oxidoreductase, partial [Actinomycetales bacterium]